MELIYQKGYEEFKKEMDAEIGGAAEGFVRIGYYLKVARDTDILKESQYEDVNAFAKARYGLDKTQVSRFIRINDRFSEGGNSMELEERYKGYGSTIMHYIPRSKGGLGSPQNGALGCSWHHHMMDNGNQGNRLEMLAIFRDYLRQQYPDWDEETLTYSKWR